jgi:CPA2 family monovalent cation:H+ antiporter-2
VVAIPDAASTRETVACARRCHPTVPILARTRYLREVEPLEALGADEVIPEEFETSIELTARVLARYGASQARIARETAALRQRHYGALRSPENGDVLLPALDGLLAESHIESLAVPSTCSGATLGDLDVRRETGATVLAIQRGDETASNPGPDETIVAGDTLVLLATSQQLQAIEALLTRSGA